MVDGLKGALTKAILETNHQRLVAEGQAVAKSNKSTEKSDASSQNDGGDAEWLESTIVADRQEMDLHMDIGSEGADDYEFDFDKEDGENSDNMDEIIQRYEEVDLEESRIDEDLEAEFRDGNNKECL